MTNLNSSNTFIGNVYPFFLNNSSMKTYYLYKIVSPCLFDDNTPALSLHKISERTGKTDLSSSEKNNFLNHGDILATLMKGKKKFAEKSVNFLLKDVLGNNRVENEEYENSVFSNGYDFPLFELDSNNNLAKSIIIGLRDSLRWNQYRFQPDSYVDILITKSQYGIFRIEGNGETIHLTPVNLFFVDDVEQNNPIKVDWSKIDYPRNKFSGVRKASDLNKAIRAIDWKSFNNEEI